MAKKYRERIVDSFSVDGDPNTDEILIVDTGNYFEAVRRVGNTYVAIPGSFSRNEGKTREVLSRWLGYRRMK